VADLQAQIAAQQRQIDELKRLIPLVGGQQMVTGAAAPTDGGLQKDEVKKIIDGYLKEKDDKKKADDEAAKKKLEDEGYRIGSDLKAGVNFRDGLFLWINTPNNDFTMHPGFWMQYDNVFWSQSPALKVPPGARPGAAAGVASGAATGGIGDLEDGTFFRRIRPFVEGTFWENGEYRLILAAENDQFSTEGLDEFWVGYNNIPLIGTVRLGHVKTPMGFEGDMTASSRCMTFMERSSYSDSIELNQNFVTGAWFSNNYLDQHATLTTAIFRADNGASSGTFFGDGQFGLQGRLTGLPLYDCDGRHLLHVGLSGGWRNGTNNIATSPLRTFQVRARPELRDDDPAGSPSGGQAVPDADSTRMVDTGVIAANQQFLMGTELLYIRGPFSFQAEYGFNWIDGAVGFAPSGYTLNPKLTSPQNYVFSGGYVQVAYTLTGENRAYDRRYGTLARDYLGKTGPFSPFWFVRDENGRLSWGPGAWEVAARYSYVNLNDGSGSSRIGGGVMDGWSVALNWYLNTNTTLMFDYVYNQRSDLPKGVFPGNTSGYGMRLQFQF
jgi:phosphate-selective porin OprO/OprP